MNKFQDFGYFRIFYGIRVLGLLDPAAVLAANGVFFIVPLNPQALAEDQERTCHCTSVAVTMLLVKLA